MFAFLIAAVLSAQTVCLTELYEVYDYDYLSDEDHYGERVVWGYTVETRHDLPNGMTGWRYAGLIQFTRIVWYGSDEDHTEAQWFSSDDRKGTETTVENAVRRILKTAGEVDIVRR